MDRFVIHDLFHCEDLPGEFTSFVSAFIHLQELARLPWGAPTTRPPCMGWQGCQRELMIHSGQEERSLSGEPLVVLSAEGARWNAETKPLLSMTELLALHNFDFERPSLANAWRAFQSFTRFGLPEETFDSLGYSCQHVADRDETLYLWLARPFTRAWGTFYCGCLLTCPVPKSLWGVREESWWWDGQGIGKEQWFAEVEQLPSFSACESLHKWRWEGFSN